VFQTGDRRKDVGQSTLFTYPSLNEQAIPQFVGESLFTNAILDLTQGERTYVCLLTGHGERNRSGESESLSQLVQFLEKANYQVQDISFEADRGWQELCEIMLIAGPRLGLHRGEDEALLQFLNAGKRLILLVDPQSQVGLSQTLTAFGLKFHDSVVFDPSRRFVLGDHYPAPRLLEHAITEPLVQEQVTPIFYLARPLLLREGTAQQGLVSTELLSTSPLAWGETNLKAQVEAKPNSDADLLGPLTLAVAVTRQGESGTTIPLAVVFGDSNFITNNLIEVPGNRELFMNSVAWLAEQQAQLAIRPHETDFRPLLLDPPQARWVSVLTQLVFPGVILGGGLSFWLRRRRR
jgi:ABC-type uncharacterized transport system involved in gliding motility auxiliary subunit